MQHVLVMSRRLVGLGVRIWASPPTTRTSTNTKQGSTPPTPTPSSHTIITNISNTNIQQQQHHHDHHHQHHHPSSLYTSSHIHLHSYTYIATTSQPRALTPSPIAHRPPHHDQRTTHTTPSVGLHRVCTPIRPERIDGSPELGTTHSRPGAAGWPVQGAG